MNIFNILIQIIFYIVAPALISFFTLKKWPDKFWLPIVIMLLFNAIFFSIPIVLLIIEKAPIKLYYGMIKPVVLSMSSCILFTSINGIMKAIQKVKKIKNKNRN